MADLADQADASITAATEAAVQAARKGPWGHVKPSGWCIWCGDPVAGGRVHCRPIDNDCEADHLQQLRFEHGDRR